MYPSICLPEYCSDIKIEELEEIVIDEYKKSHPGFYHIILVNQDDPTRGKVISLALGVNEDGSEMTLEDHRFQMEMDFSEEDLKYLVIV